MGKSIIKSLTGNLWEIQNNEIIRKENVVDVLLKNRNFDRSFLNIKLKNTMPDPYSFIDMEKAINRIVQAILNRQPIAILGDYDVDGISSTSIFAKFFQELSLEYAYSIPNRLDDGYGLSVDNIEKYKDYLIIAVDCGSTAFNELQYAKEHQIDLIVIDHHKLETVPEAFALVNPHRPDEKDDFKYLCATALSFMCVVGIRRVLEKNQIQNLPNLINYLDLVSLATICDVMPLKGLNRAFVTAGLKVIQNRTNLGIATLCRLSNKFEINEEVVGFFIGPHLNAAGRIATADLGVELLTTNDSDKAMEIALKLLELNKTRQKIESDIITEATTNIDTQKKCICLFNKNWHLGVIGIVAGRLKEKYNKPSIIISCDVHGQGKASCRSIPGLDISAIIKKGIANGILASGGGHTLAGGFSIDINNISTFQSFLEEEIPFIDSQHKYVIDGFLDSDCFCTDFINEFSLLAPFGHENKSPLFIIPHVDIISTQIQKEQHISAVCKLSNGSILKGIAFRSYNSQLGDILLQHPANINILGSLSCSQWKGKEYINFHILDVAKM